MRKTALYILISSVLTILGTHVVQAEADRTIQIAGVVLDNEDGSPIPGATVQVLYVDSSIAGCATDINGEFTLTLQDRPHLILSVASLGYASTSIELESTQPDLSALTIRLHGELFESDPVLILGRSARAARRNVGTMSEIRSEQFDLVRPVGTQEMLEYVPGINGFSDDGMGNSRLNIGIRGLNPRRSSRVLVLEDGVPIQPAPYIYPNMYYNPPTERIERIEVLKGSAAIEYGPQTMGGVINYITSRPRSAPGGEIELAGGTNGLLSGFVEAGGIGTDALQVEGELLYKRGDGFRRNNAFEQINGSGKIVLIPSDDRTIYLKGNFNHEVSSATYTGLTQYSFGADPDFNPKENDQFQVDRYSLDGVMHRELSSSLRSMTRLYLNLFKRDWWREDDLFYRASEYLADPSTAEPVPWYEPGDLVRAGNGSTNFGILRTFTSLGVEQNYNLAIDSLPWGSGSTLLGGRVHWERFLDHKVVGASPDARSGTYYQVSSVDSSITVHGVNAHYETLALSLYGRQGIESGPLSATFGLRFEAFEQEQIDRLDGSRYQDKSTVILLPGCGVNFELGSTNLFAGIHRGYTPPSSGALKSVGFSPAGSSGIDLGAETSWNIEAGARGSYKGVQFELAAFDIIVQDLVAAGRGTLFQNLGSATSRGVETGIVLRGSDFEPRLPNVEFSWTWLQTEVLEGHIPSAVLAGDVLADISGNELPYAPHHTLTAGISSSIDERLSVRFDVHHVSSSYSDFENIRTTNARGDSGPIPAHTTMSCSISWGPTDRIRLHLSGKNLADAIYIGSRLHSNPRQTEAGASSGIIPGGRRQVTLAVRYSFGKL